MTATQREMEQHLQGQRLIRARFSAGILQSQVAGAMGIDQSTYSGYETGRRAIPAHLVEPLCRILKLRPDVLFGMVSYSSTEPLEEIVISDLRKEVALLKSQINKRVAVPCGIRHFRQDTECILEIHRYGDHEDINGLKWGNDGR